MSLGDDKNCQVEPRGINDTTIVLNLIFSRNIMWLNPPDVNLNIRYKYIIALYLKYREYHVK